MTKYDKHGAVRVYKNSLIDHNGISVTLEIKNIIIDMNVDKKRVRESLSVLISENNIDGIRFVIDEEKISELESVKNLKDSLLVKQIDNYITAATEIGLYVIVSTSFNIDNNHNDTYINFWSRIVGQYYAYGNIFYEINEANSKFSDVYNFLLEEIVSIIRMKDIYGVIIADNELKDKNYLLYNSAQEIIRYIKE